MKNFAVVQNRGSPGFRRGEGLLPPVSGSPPEEAEKRAGEVTRERRAGKR